jgi:hypothetical protein
MSFLHSLPDAVICSILGDFCDSKTLTFLDNAYCNKEDRIIFLKLISSVEFVATNEFALINETSTSSHVFWLSFRRVCVKKLIICGINDTSDHRIHVEDFTFLSKVEHLVFTRLQSVLPVEDVVNHCPSIISLTIFGCEREDVEYFWVQLNETINLTIIESIDLIMIVTGTSDEVPNHLNDEMNDCLYNFNVMVCKVVGSITYLDDLVFSFFKNRTMKLNEIIHNIAIRNRTANELIFQSCDVKYDIGALLALPNEFVNLVSVKLNLAHEDYEDGTILKFSRTEKKCELKIKYDEEVLQPIFLNPRAFDVILDLDQLQVLNVSERERRQIIDTCTVFNPKCTADTIVWHI